MWGKVDANPRDHWCETNERAQGGRGETLGRLKANPLSVRGERQGARRPGFIPAAGNGAETLRFKRLARSLARDEAEPRAPSERACVRGGGVARVRKHHCAGIL